MIAPGFERVAEVFARKAAEQPTGGLAFAATVEGEPVVDLVAGEARPGEPWTSDTRAVVMSVSKGWSVLSLQLLVERGALTLDTRVAEIWPEYGVAGKDRTLVRHLLEHTAGSIGIPDVGSLLGWDGKGWDDLDGIAERLAAATPAWEPGTRCGYHAVTFGWLVGELIRRIDGRTLGTFFHDEIAAPLGIRTAIGVPRAEQGDVAQVLPGAALIDKWFLRPILAKVPAQMRDPRTLLGQAFLGDGERSIMDAIDDLLVDGRFLAAEVPSSNGVSSATDVARLYAVLANGGELDGVRRFAPATMELLLRSGPTRPDTVMADFAAGSPIFGRLIRGLSMVTRSEGGLDMNVKRAGKRACGPNPRTVGNGGAGGQLAFADPTARVSGAFVRSAMSPVNTTQLALVDALYSCLGKAHP